MRFVCGGCSLLVFALMPFISGCGSAANLGKPVPVKGKVTLADGQPLQQGTVAFFPEDPAKGNEDFASVNPDGTFETTVFPGKYKIAVEPDWVRKAGVPGVSPIPETYRSPKTSQLDVEIPSGGKDDVTITLR